MTKQEKEKFIKTLMSNIQQQIITAITYMPENWDGHELRQYIADYCKRNCAYFKMDKHRKN